MEGLTPKEIVAYLDKYIVGQDKAKKVVAVALRNRKRRRLLGQEIREEVSPNNILMICPTGVGKTEIARRLAKLAGAPFVKVEATKFTEVGYVGRDVEAIIRDLVEESRRIVKNNKIESVREMAKDQAELDLLDILAPTKREEKANPFSVLFGTEQSDQRPQVSPVDREEIKRKLEQGEMEDELIEINVPEREPQVDLFSFGMDDSGFNLQDLFSGFMPKRTAKKKVTVKKAREILTEIEAEKLLDKDSINQEAIELAQNEGIVFIDEIDKIAGGASQNGPDVSREGVQRDILPILEGSVVATKYGHVKTDYILFIAAGAFHISKPSQLIPELQGRLPVRVELSSLTEEDFVRILKEPKNSLLYQYKELLKTEGVEVEFTKSGIREIAASACKVNENTEDIGARRLNTILENVLEEVSFEAPDLVGQKVVIDDKYVEMKIGDLIKDRDLSQYIL
ncbi:MAG: ATP-dependent protease ATPase subunit HslU [Firmicutes bacterium]|nr:ATP-dependent protease ATPase subunit HslU [Bacillota bacterium]